MKKKLRKKNECAIELRLHNLSLGLSQRNWLFNNRNDWMENKSINTEGEWKINCFYYQNAPDVKTETCNCCI